MPDRTGIFGCLWVTENKEEWERLAAVAPLSPIRRKCTTSGFFLRRQRQEWSVVQCYSIPATRGTGICLVWLRELMGTSILWMPSGLWEQERLKQPVFGEPELIVLHTITRRSKIMSSWKGNQQASLIEKLYTQALQSHIPPKRFQRPPECLPRLIGEGLLLYKASSLKTGRSSCFFQMHRFPILSYKHLKKQGHMIPKRYKINLQKSILKKWSYINYVT